MNHDRGFGRIVMKEAAMRGPTSGVLHRKGIMSLGIDRRKIHDATIIYGNLDIGTLITLTSHMPRIAYCIRGATTLARYKVRYGTVVVPLRVKRLGPRMTSNQNFIHTGKNNFHKSNNRIS